MSIPRPAPSVPAAIDEAEHDRRRRNYAIYPIVRRRAVSLIGGANGNGSGKNMLFAQLLAKWKLQPDTFGYPNYPLPFAVVCCLQMEDDFRSLAANAGLDDTIPIIAAYKSNKPVSFREICLEARKLNPKVKVLWLDSIHELLPPTVSVISYGPVSKLMNEVRRLLVEMDLTLIASGANSKPKPHRVKPIDLFLGSGAWVDNCSCFIGIEYTSEDDADPHRRVTITSREAHSVHHLEFSKSGLLVESHRQLDEENGLRERLSILICLIEAHPDGAILSRAQIVEMASTVGIEPWSCDRYLAILKSEGRLRSAGFGKYTVPFNQ